MLKVCNVLWLEGGYVGEKRGRGMRVGDEVEVCSRIKVLNQAIISRQE